MNLSLFKRAFKWISNLKPIFSHFSFAVRRTKPQTPISSPISHSPYGEPTPNPQRAFTPLRQRLRRVKVASPAFTIVELVIVITIMGILVTLGVVNLRGSQANSRDAERKVDIETIAQHLESYYSSGTDTTTTAIDCTGGDSITHDGLYTVHKFTTVGAGTLTCSNSLSAEVLVVGGGGRGEVGGGGGGGGGYLTSTEMLSGTINIMVGSSANNSSLGSLISYSGGSAPVGTQSNGYTGASGSGGSGSSIGTTIGGLATPAYPNAQGYAGGGNGGYISGSYPAGGGGGAGAVGGNATSTSQHGNGGAGLNNDIILRGTYVGYSGGGGGGNLGYGGTAGTATHGGGIYNTAGTNNTGGGGGGGGSGSAGGSGIVIVRYLTPTNATTHSISYPSTAITANITSDSTTDSVRLMLPDIDISSVIAPGLASPGDNSAARAGYVISTFKPATCSGTCDQTTAGVLPQPTKDQYVYQPIQTNGTLCTTAAQECRKFNLYYRSEVDDTVKMVTSINQ